MKKEVYMPNEEQLYKIQELAGANYLYTYLLVKTVESLIINRKADKSILEGTTKVLREDYYISRAIGYLYPEEVMYSETAGYDIGLALDILGKSRSNEIYNIDEIRHFDSSTIYADRVLKKVISLLKKELGNCPTYRFEYLDNPLLDSIFSVDIEYLNQGYDYNSISDKLKDLIEVEPAYGIILPDQDFYSDVSRQNSLIQGIERYSNRYNISSLAGSDYYGKDILSNPDSNVKRLLKCINKRQ